MAGSQYGIISPWLQRVLYKLHSRDSWYSQYDSGSQYTKIVSASGFLNATVSQGILTRFLIFLRF